MNTKAKKQPVETPAESPVEQPSEPTAEQTAEEKPTGIVCRARSSIRIDGQLVAAGDLIEVDRETADRLSAFLTPQ